ncbi:MAG: hypothetical protein WC423_25940, partial [Vulcanimicrobiota bacterium]
AEWDGTVDGQSIEDPETYQFHIYANVCPEDNGGGASRAIRAQEDIICLEDDERVAIGITEAKLEAFFVDPSQNRNKIALGFTPDLPNAEALFKEKGELTRELYRVGNGDRLFLELQFSREPSPELTTVDIELGASSSNSLASATLHQDEIDKTLFKGELVIPSGFLQHSSGSGTRYNLGTLAFSESDANDWVAHVLPTFQQPHQKFGVYQEILFDSRESPTESDQVVSKPVHLAKFGFETLSISTKAPLPRIKATINVPNPDSADVVAWTFHGLPNGELLPSWDIGGLLGDTTLRQNLFIPGLNISPQDSSNLDTLFLSACSALHLKDYNQTGLTPSTSGALEWHDATGQGQTLLLGYQYYAARTNVPLVYQAYASEYQRLASISDPRERQILSWMSANLKVGTEGDEEALLALGACAVDRDWFYYIPARYVQQQGDAKPRPIPETASDIFRVPRLIWSLVPVRDWESNRDTFAEKVTIP